MTEWRRVLRWLAVAGSACASLLPAPEAVAAAAAPARLEVRALWIDSAHPGIRSATEIRELVDAARRNHVNTLFVQVRRRGEALYTGGIEPSFTDPAYDPSFDALEAAVAAGHAAGIEVHAWINAMPIWRGEAPPAGPQHVFNLHGPSASGTENWLTRARDDRQVFPVGYFVDPGHPAAQEHLVRIYLDVVRRYAVDGVHFDYIRYPETEDRPPRGADVGYNAVSLARFQRTTGRSDVPASDDPAWTAWRRLQVTQLVRRISVEARAINPRVKVSAATIAWGRPPLDRRDFENTAPMQRIFQDWPAWLAEGLLDMAVPMNYAREADPVVRGWFDGWIAWEKRHKAERQLVIGIGGYLSAPEGVLAQITRARARDSGRHADGVSLFSYFRPAGPPPTADGETLPTVAAPDRLDFLSRGAARTTAVFTTPAAVPATPWLDRPERGFLAGTVTSSSGLRLDGARIAVRRTGWFRRTLRTTSDGNGWFGLTGLKPGRYRVRVEPAADGIVSSPVEIEVRAGAVGRAALQTR